MEKERVLEMLDCIREALSKAEGITWIKAGYNVHRDVQSIPTRHYYTDELTGYETLSINIDYFVTRGDKK